MPDWLKKILESGAVWSALIALVNVLLKYFAPNLSSEIVLALNALLVAILAAVGVQVNRVLRAG